MVKTMEVGFIGLGQMGKWESSNLIKAGFNVTVYDINRKAVQALVKTGAKSAKSPREVAQKCRVVIICVSTAEAMEEIVLGESGVLTGARKGDILIDTGTTDPLLTCKIYDIALKKGVRALDAPVLGGVPGARQGILTVIVGGDKEIFDKCLDIFKGIGKNIFFVGRRGNGMIVKLVNNCISTANIALFSEGLVLGVKAGIDAKTLYEIIKTGTGNSWQFQMKVPRILKRDFEPLARMNVAYKDLLLGNSMARRLKVPLPVTNAAIQMFEMARSMNLDEEDMLAVVKVLEKAVDVEVKE